MYARHVSKRLNARQFARPAFLTVGLAMLGGCSAVDILAGPPDLPEGENVAAAPWPRLADAPAPTPLTDADALDGVRSVESLQRKAATIEAESGDRFEMLRDREAELLATDSLGRGVYARADRLRARARSLAAR